MKKLKNYKTSPLGDGNQLYQILKNWEKKDDIRLMYALGVIRPVIMDWLTYYEAYRELRKRRPELNKTEAVQWIADDYNLTFRTVWDIVQYFCKPIEVGRHK